MKHPEFDKTDQYLLGKLSDQEAQDFRLALSKDQNLAEEVEIRKAIISGLNEQYKLELKEKLAAYDSTLDKKNWITPFLKIAAVITVFLITVVGVYQFTSQDKFAEFDFYEEGIPNTMSKASEDELLQMAMNEFKLENYANAIGEFERASTSGIVNDTILYHMGVSYYREDELASAQISFQQIDHLSSYYEKATFRRNVILYQLGDQEEAIDKMSEIAKSKDHPFSQEAASFLEKVE